MRRKKAKQDFKTNGKILSYSLFDISAGDSRPNNILVFLYRDWIRTTGSNRMASGIGTGSEKRRTAKQFVFFIGNEKSKKSDSKKIGTK